MPTQEERVLELVRKAGVIRPLDLKAHGLPRNALSRLLERGEVRRIARGLYELTKMDPVKDLSLVEVSKRVPHGIVCLISALAFHELTTQVPHQVWLAIDGKAHKPRFKYPPVRFVRFSGKALTSGVEIHEIRGVPVRVTTPAKTVADCFKYRNKVGLDIALEALREYRRQRTDSIGELWESAEVCRMTKVMRPYLEAMA